MNISLTVSLLAVLALAVSAQSTWPKYYLFTKSNPSNKIELTDNNIDSIGFSKTKDTYFLIHGFGDSSDATKLRTVKDALLTKYDVNAVIVDWAVGAASPDYFSAMANQKTTGQTTASFIVRTGINPKKTTCVGHSLGAHACGHLGKQLQALNAQKLARISGIDPAGPLFKGTVASNRLDKTDADLVDNIHTDNLLGINDAIGHKDYFPAGGKNQPACTKSTETMKFNFFPPEFKADPVDALSCSHTRGPFYYAESILSSCPFTSTPCSDYNTFLSGGCKCNPTYGCSSMGFFASKSAEEGKFYLDINKAEPYCLS